MTWKKLNPADLHNSEEFELLTEVSHQKLREFVVEQVNTEKYLIRIYSIYQGLMVIFFVFLLTKSLILVFKGYPEYLFGVILALLFSVSGLIVLHELLHALAYLLSGARNISFGFILKKFVFYAMADQQVIKANAFRFVALVPFVVVKLICLTGALTSNNVQIVYFYLTVMCVHSLFCAGDIAMLAFYRLHRGKEIYNFDNRSEGKTYFYARKQ